MKFVSWFLFSIVLIGCKTSVYNDDLSLMKQPRNFDEIFDAFWYGMSSHYIYWDIDTTDWAMIYKKYKPLFQRLDVNNKNDVSQSADYLREITRGLIDSHFQIVFEENMLAGAIIFPAADRKAKESEFRLPFDYSVLDEKYFDVGYLHSIDEVTKYNKKSQEVKLATIRGNIIYFHCNQFSLERSYYSKAEGNVKFVLDKLFDRIYQNHYKGLIIDLRNNSGGDLADLNFFLNHFAQSELTIGYSKYKRATGMLDYSPWIKATIPSTKGEKGNLIPIVILADRFTVSTAELIMMSLYLLPNVKIIGETSWGATGPIGATNLFQAGTFRVPGYLTVYTSSAAFKYFDGRIYEGIGFPPDVLIPFNSKKIADGIDTQLEYAISVLDK
ncbi:S41 family peptidase [Sphingobacterium detergens]|uniref:Peptidase S41-like protein n=1 Tax=Sphingobacterium detergens TaxID=1145106 RepID=A0A420BIU3_SPHD1|nr:S41 family peptidase [Sphingobacterium detergens]RKE56597.1 peptidase S41-like protein [Sphingobacterium detergens]